MRGLLGKATDDFCEDGRLVEKTTYGKSPREFRGAQEEGVLLPLHLLPSCFTPTWAMRVPLKHSQTHQARAGSWGRGHVILSSENSLSSPRFLTWLKCPLPREASPAPRLGPGVLSEKSSADDQWF